MLQANKAVQTRKTASVVAFLHELFKKLWSQVHHHHMTKKMSRRATCTSSAWSRSGSLMLVLQARELRPRMSSIGVGNRADIALASKLLTGTVPSCT